MLTYKITDFDLHHIAENMRQADRDEVAAASGLPPLEVLKKGILNSDICWCFRHHGEPIFLVGIGGDGDFGGIWLLGTDSILKHKRFLHKLAKSVIAEWHLRWPKIGNIVDARNTVHIRWLKAMGFTFSDPVIAGVAQIPFIPFHRELNV